jgi:2-dehydro-3-deoxyglucarate aldolase/4-hydroxy-2-oxoheptanedioate aldolase
MQKNTVKESLKAGECVYGTSLEDCLDPEMAVMLAAAGLDFFFIDTEHSTASYAQIQALCRAGRAASIIALVRVTENEPYLISRALDVGAMGVIVPRLRSVEEAKAALSVMKFPPLGRRGFGLRSIVTDLQGTPATQQIESANHETLAVLMIETREAVDCVEEIASLPGLDVLFIGPYDLTLSLGILEQFDNLIFWQAVDRVVKACEKAGVAAGLQSSDMPLLLQSRTRGVRFLMYSSDVAVLLKGYKQAATALKGVPTGGHVRY